MLLNIKQLENNQQSQRKISVFAQISRQIKQWQMLSQQIQPLLPQPEQWQIICYQAGVLTIAGRNQVMISQLNYLRTQYTQQLAQLEAFRDLTRLQAILLPLEKTNTPPPKPVDTIDATTRECFAELVDEIEDPTLKQAFKKLATAPKPFQ